MCELICLILIIIIVFHAQIYEYFRNQCYCSPFGGVTLIGRSKIKRDINDHEKASRTIEVCTFICDLPDYLKEYC